MYEVNMHVKRVDKPNQKNLLFIQVKSKFIYYPFYFLIFTQTQNDYQIKKDGYIAFVFTKKKSLFLG